MYTHFHTVQPIFSTDNASNDILSAIHSDFIGDSFSKQDDDFWFGVNVDRYLELSDEDLDKLKQHTSDVLRDIPTIWDIKSVVRDKPDRLIFLVGTRGILAR